MFRHPMGLKVTRHRHGNVLIRCAAGFIVFISSSMSALSSVFTVSAMPGVSSVSCMSGLSSVSVLSSVSACVCCVCYA